MPKKDNQKAFATQHDDEEVLMVFRRHPVAMRYGLIAFLIGVLLGMIPVTIWPDRPEYLWFIIPGMLIGGLVLFYYWIAWFFSIFIITDQRLIQITQKGFFNRTVVDIGLDKIQNINYQIKGFQQTVLGFGTILVQTFVGDMVIDKVHHPHELQDKIVKLLKEQGVSAQFFQNIAKESQEIEEG